MTYKEFGENADINIQVKVFVNDELVITSSSYTIDDTIAKLGTIERSNVISRKIEEQYQDLDESDIDND